MILKYCSTMWAAIAPALGNHLWQSTLFAMAAGLLTLLLRNNHARIRYWLWLAASLKFFIPFSLLISMGGEFAWWHRSAGPNEGVYFLMEQVGQPFALARPVVSEPATLLSVTTRFLPIFLLAAWLCGSLVVLVLWWQRWRRVATAVRHASPVNSGREFDALRQIERNLRIPKPVDLLVAESSLEPGIVGIFSPVMFLPDGIAERLTDQQLAAVVTHELCHVLRRDNLAAALHMLVEATFWFHPLVWWLGARLVEERERACDEEVLELGSDRQVYAESILKVCEFYVESPLVCAAGVTGSNLKKRIEEIMNHRIARKLEVGKKLLLASTAAAAVLGPLIIGVMNPTPSRAESQAEGTLSAAPAFASVSIKQNTTGVPMPPFKIIGDPGQIRGISTGDGTRFLATLFPLRGLIHFAYGIPENQIKGGPGWLDTAKYDIVAKADQSQIDELGKLSQDRREFVSKRMLQALLTDHFKLAFHREMQELQTYGMVVGSNGLKIIEVASAPQPNDQRIIQNQVIIKPGHLEAANTSMEQLALVLTDQTGVKLTDKTNLKGFYNVTLDWQVDSSDSADSLATALRDQLGVELKEQTSPVEMLVVDHAEQPEPASGETNSALSRQSLLVDNTALANLSPSVHPALIHVREEVMNGLILQKVPPQYPQAARDAQIQGAVIMDATIGKAGDIENLQILSGHPMLAPAALEAVKQWKYKPFLLNGEPVEVLTQVEVDFTLGF